MSLPDDGSDGWDGATRINTDVTEIRENMQKQQISADFEGFSRNHNFRRSHIVFAPANSIFAPLLIMTNMLRTGFITIECELVMI